MPRPYLFVLLAVLWLCTNAAALAADQVGEIDEDRPPQPAEIMPLATQSILLDITRAGDRYVIVGERGHILLSEDGADWRQVQAPVRAMLTRVEFIDADNGWAVGHDGSVLRSTDGGETWQLKHFEPGWGRPFYDVLILEPERVMVVGTNGRLLVTEDGGENWREIESEVFSTGGYHISMLTKLNDGSLVAVGERGFLARSADGGETWEMLTPPYIGSYFGVLPYGATGALFYGLQGRVYVAEDVSALPTQDPAEYDPFISESVEDPARLAAMGWRQIEEPLGQSLFGAARFGDTGVVLVGVDGTVVAGDIRGDELRQLPSPTDQPLSAVIVEDDKLLMVGRGGIYRINRKQ